MAFFWIKAVLHNLIGPLVHGMMTDPICEREKITCLNFRAAVDFLADVWRKRPYEHDLRMVVANTVAVCLEDAHPIINMLGQVAHVGASLVLLQL